MQEYSENEPFNKETIADSDEMDEVERRKKNRSNFVQVIVLLLTFITFYFLIPEYVIERFPVDGTSMESCLYDGESVLVEKISRRIGNIERFDVIVFYLNNKEAKDYYIKRVIGLPGESIQIINGIIFINGEPLNEDYGKDDTDYSGLAEYELIIGPHEYFVLGDNRKISLDSRYESIGMVSYDQIIGQAFIRVWPLNKLSFIK